MKFRTFRNIVAMVLFMGTGATCYGCYAYWQKSLADEEFARRDAAVREEAEAARRKQIEIERQAALASRSDTAPSTTTTPTTASHWQQAAGLREVDKDALTALSRPVVDKIKDAAKGRPWKINVYADDGARFNRLKIDLDRDEKDDEGWTIFADGHIERKVSTKDNGTFDVTMRLEMSGWVDMSAAPAPATAPTPTATATATNSADGLRTVDRDMFGLVKSLAPTEKVKDATKGKPYKINLYSDDGARFNRAKIDLDRDDKWDESWTWKPEGIERQVAPADDERYSDVYRLEGERWLKK